ncbi:MAG: alpha/beta hydrolase [Bacteroidetes bacterium]|nr:alpha/beta hydrolase [Bacteroidota bacterium]MBS1929959.1 alpha/beta hydrolase [Bacteroidota bacterium]
MRNDTSTYKNSKIHSQCFGTGERVALCFHGYGESADSFAFLEKYAGTQFRFHAFDLPFHGKTEWKEGLNFSSEDILQICNETPELTDKRMTLIGYSLGGRIALSLFQLIPDKIENVTLMAPDGLKVNFWYWLTTQTSLGNKLFAFTMKHPGWFFSFLKLLNRLGFVNASIFKFVNYYIENKEARDQLYNRWTVFRKIKPSISRIKFLIRKHKTPVQLIYGKYDRIILPVRGKKFQKGIESFCTIKIIPSGHQVLHENHIKEILPALLTTPGNE